MALVSKRSLGGVWMCVSDATPNASITAPKGSFCSDAVGGAFYGNTDGATAWAMLGAGIIKQVIYSARPLDGTKVTGTTTIPYDNTAPTPRQRRAKAISTIPPQLFLRARLRRSSFFAR